MSAADRFVKANESYTKAFNQGGLLSPPSLKVAVITCMDARIDPAASLGIGLGQAHVIRNAGGRAADALRSVVISQQLLGTREILVIHHTGCGMLSFTDEDLRGKLREWVAPGAKSNVDSIAFLPFRILEQAVKEDVAFLKESPLILPETKDLITGYIYDVDKGSIHKVV